MSRVDFSIFLSNDKEMHREIHFERCLLDNLRYSIIYPRSAYSLYETESERTMRVNLENRMKTQRQTVKQS